MARYLAPEDFELLIKNKAGDYWIVLKCPEHGEFGQVTNVQEVVDEMTDHLIKVTHHKKMEN